MPETRPEARIDALQVFTVTGAGIAPYLADVARLRIEVFREYPYLYDGDADYEARYLGTYSASPESLFVLVRDPEHLGRDGRIVGASTAVPMAHEEAAFRQPFADRGLDPAKIFYYGESVIARSHRGRGLGGRFFDEREAYARGLGRFTHLVFSAVERAPGDPRWPSEYRPLDDFWQRRGFRKMPDFGTTYSWKELGESSASPKAMGFWIKELG
ncbi:MAG TPA: GNAT family N-acetyltransferase [Haliangium sp.]|nr:GNAT family N-acetyltransferase [Haliangium sp.]